MNIKNLKTKVSTILQMLAVVLLSTMSASARPIGGWAHSANNSGNSIAWDSPVGITILVSIAVFLILVTLLVIWGIKRGKLRVRK